MGKTSIQWTAGDDGSPGSNWNPIRGCSRISPGCGRGAGEGGCYAERQAYRFSGPGQPYEGLVRLGKQGPRWTGKVRLIPEKLDEPLRWRKPRRVFVNSMSDLFHESLTNEQIAAVFGVMAAAPRHTFQVLTKRAKRMREWFSLIGKLEDDRIRGDGAIADRCATIARQTISGDPTNPYAFCFSEPRAWPLPNVWLGVSVENQECADQRIPELVRTPAAIRFVSYEPALGPVDFNLPLWVEGGPDWIIVGGESGPGARSFDIDWARSVIAQCSEVGAACFVKQLGGHPVEHRRAREREVGSWAPLNLKDRHGGDMAEWPEDLRVREFPKESTS